MDGSFQPKTLTSDKNQGLSPAFLSGTVQTNVFFAQSETVVPKLAAVASQAEDALTKVSVPAHPAARVAFVKKFNANNVKRVLAGLPLLVLLLPDMAAAQSNDFVSLNSVEGVANATVLDNGNVRVTLDNGRRLTIDADAVEITTNGEILVSQAAVGAIGEAVLLAAGGVGGAGGAIAGLLGGAAALGGGGGGGGGGSAPVTSGGRVVDGYISGATVFRDLNDNGVFDAGEPNVLTDNEGNFTGLAVDSSNPNAKILAVGGTDIATGKAFVGTLSAPADATVVTPITTLVQALVEKAEADGSPITASAAAAQVTSALGLGSSDVLNEDPVAAAEEGDLTALKAATQIANVINIAAAASSDGSGASAQAAESLADELVNNNNRNALNDETTLQTVLQDAVGAAKANDLAAAASNANTVINNAADDETGLTQIEQVLTVVQGDVVDDVKAGNDVGTTDIEAEASAIVPLRPTLDRGDTEINAASKANGIGFSGTGRPGTEITVDFGGATKTTTTAADGSWSVNYTSAEFPADPAGGTVTVSVTAKENPSDPPSPAATRTISLDSTAPSAPGLDPVAGDGTVNGAEAAAGFTATGTGEAGATVAVTMNAGGAGAVTKSVSVASDGTWSATFGASEVPADGAQTIEAVQTDAVGNSSPTANGTFTVDTAATAQPTIAIVATDDIVNASEKAAGVDVTGTAEANASVAVTFGATTKTVTAAGDGSYTASFTEAELPGDGLTNISVVATDAVGNASPAQTRSVELNTAPPGAPAFNAIATDDVVNLAEAQSAFTFSGTVPTGSSVSVTFNGTTVAANVDGSGNWTADLSSAGLPSDGQTSVSATATDGNGNTATSTRSFLVDTATATPTINAVSGDDLISAADAAAGVSVTGTAEAGASVAVTIAGGATHTVTADASGNFAAAFASADLPGNGTNIQVSAVATDAAGNTATGTRSIVIDSSAPTTPSISVISNEGTINLAEAAAGVNITGSAEAGTSVAVTFGSVTKTVTADAGGGFSAAFSSRELPEDGTYTVNAVATDSSGNVSPAGSASVTVDTKAPPVPTINVIAGDDVVNATEKLTPSVTGTAEANATVIVKAGDTTKTTTADGSGNWSVNFTQAELPSTDITGPVTARAVDASGNQSTAALREVTFDTVVNAPVINAVGATTPDLVNAAEKAAGLTVTGTAEVGATVTLTLAGTAKTATAAADGTWSVSFTAAEQPVTDGVYALTASAVDTAGNTTASPGTRPITYDTAAPAAPVVNTISSDNVLNSGEVTAGGTVTGTAEANATITVDFRVPATVSGARATALQESFESRTTQADGNGNWTLSWTSADFPEGTVVVGATATDAAGNSSTETTVDVTVDLTPPTGSIGTVATDDVVSKTEADAGFSVDVTAGSDTASVQITVGTTTKTATLSGGTYSATFVTAELPNDGTHSISATLTDTAGNTSTVTRSVVIETQPPAAPVIDDVTADNVVNAAEAGAALTLTGTAEAGSTVAVTLNSNTQTATADATTGVWSVSFTSGDLPTTDGTHQISATATDAANNTSVAGTKDFTLDTSGPAAPTFDPVTPDDVINAIEQAAGVDVTGTTEAGASVSVTMTPSGGSPVTRTATADGSGVFSVNFTSAEIPTSGTVDFVATATDTAGNQGTSSAAKTVTINTTSTATPVIDAVTGDNFLNASEVTSDVVISGSAEAGASVSFTFGTISRTLTADASTGVWTTTIASGDLPSEGVTNVQVTATGGSGVQSAAATQAVTIDTSAPVAPSVAAFGGDGVINAAEAAAGIDITGTGEPGSTITVDIPTGSNSANAQTTLAVKTATVDASGNWSVSFTGPELPAVDGPFTVSATQTDQAGNTSPAGTATFTLDTIAPAAPTLNDLGDNVINSTESIATQTMTGTAEANSSVTVTITPSTGSAVTLNTTADGSGAFSVSISVSDFLAAVNPDLVITATATDAAGNTSPASASKTLTFDTSAPAAPSIDTVAIDDVINATEAAGGVTISGTAEAGSSVSFAFGSVLRTLSADASTGVWSTTVAAGDMSEGANSVFVRATDTAGNLGASATRDVTVDTAAPGAPSFNLVEGDGVVNASELAGGVTVSGTGEVGAVITVSHPLVADASVISSISGGTFPVGSSKTVVVDGSGNWTVDFVAADFPAGTPVDGQFIVAAFATDAAGNVGSVLGQPFELDTTAPTPPTINAVASDNVIDDAEHGAGVSVSGSTTANTAVTVVMTPTSGSAVTKTVTADGSGNYSASFSTAELPTSGTATFTATVSDAAGNTATATQAVPVFTGATATPTVDTVAGDGVVNSTEAASPVVISGTAEDGASVAINFSTLGVQTVTATGGTWSYTIAPGSLPADGSTETFSVVATGQSGVPSAQASGTFTVNTSGPTLAVDNVTADNIVNGTEYDAGITVTGTTDTNSGSIDVTIGSVTKTVSPTGGTWSASFTGAELGADGAKTVNVSQVDGANTGTASANFTLDAIVDYTVTIPINSDHAWLDTALDQNATVVNPSSTSFELVGVAPFNTVGATGMKAIFTGTGFTTDGLVPPSILSGTVTDVAIEIDTGSGFNEAFRINGISFDLIAAITASGTEIAGGGTGLNTIYGLFDPYKIHFEGSAQNDRLNGGQNGDLINGNDGDDNLFGFEGANTLDGGAGNDLLNNGADAGETFDGGADTDTLVYDLSGVSSPAAVNVDFSGGTATLGTNTDSVTNVENLRVLGSSNVTFTGDGQANLVETDEGNDNISTGGGNDTVDSGSGNDTIDTGAGDDTIIFDPINTGAKTVSDSSGSDTIVIIDNPGLDDGGLVQDGAGNVVFTSAQTGSTITFAAGSMDFMRWESAAGSSNPYTSTLAISTASGTVNADNTWVAGTSGADTITLSELSAQTTTIGGIVSGGGGADNITLNFSNFSYALGGDGADTITATGTGGVGLNGDAGNDTLTGSSDADTLRGGDDDDRLIGNGGDDSINGGAGTDTVVLSGALADYTISISGSTVTLVNGSETDTVDGVENFEFSDQTVALANLNPSVATRTITFLQGADAGLLADNTFLDPTAVFSTDGSGTQLSLTKTNASDFGGQTVVGTLTGTGFTFDANDDPTGGTVTGSSYSVGGVEVMTTTELNVSLVQLGTALQNAQNGDFAALQAIYNNVPINVVGSSGDDRRNGNDANDTFNGNGGNDYFDGRGGNDTLNGGDGDDWLEGRDGNDSLVGGAGDDELHAGDNNDTLIGGAGRDHLEGHEGNDLLDSSGDASDAASQGFGDIVLPGEGNDTIIGHAEAYAATAGGGVDLIYENLSSAVTVTFSGTQGSGTTTGTGKSDTFTFVDHVEGTNFADTFTGSAGGSGANNDRESWVGEAGNDTIDGNGGTDMVQYYLEGGQRGVAVDLASGSAIDTYGDVDTLINIDWAQGTDLADVLIGDANDNFLHGRDGTDAINMGAGNDFVRGGSGGDLFLYSSGHDTIADFELGIDEIDLTQTGANMADIQLALSQATESTTAVSGVTSVIIPIDANNSLTLGGVTLAEIQAAAANLDGVLARSISVLTNDTQSYNFDTFFIEPILAPTDPVVFVNGNELTFTQRGPNNNFGQDIVARVVGTGFTFNGNDPFQPTGGRITAIAIELNGQPVIVTQEPGIELTDFITGVAASTNQNTAAFNDVFSDYRVNVTGNSASVFVPDPIQFGSSPFMDFYSLSTQNDNASGGDGNDFINGDAGNDDLSGNDGDDFILGEAGEDYLNGGAGDDYLHGGADDDYFEPGAGDDVVIGGAGEHDTVSYESSNGAVNVNLADGTASDGEGGTDTLVEIERARGGRFADTLTGDDGRNVFAGNAGNDTMDGGDGVDRVRYDREFRMDGSTQGVTVDLGAGTATDSFGNADTLISIERATGTEWDDSLTGSTEDNDLEGDGGNDTLTGGAGNDWMEGGRGFDHFVIGSGHNTIADFQLGIDSLQFDMSALGLTQAQLELAFANNTQATLSYVEVSFGGNNSLRFEGLSETEVQMIPLDGQQVTPSFSLNYLVAGADLDNLFSNTIVNDAANVQINGGTITLTAATGESAVIVIEDPDIRFRSSGPEVRGGTLQSITFSDNGVPQVTLTGGEIAALPFVRAVDADVNEISNGNSDPNNLNSFLSKYTQNHIGSSGADVIEGGDGDDIIFGNDGDDSIVSYTGDDIIIAGGGEDFVVLGQVTGFDAVTGDPIFDLVSADGNNDIEVALTPADPANDFVSVIGFDTSGLDFDFITLTAPGANNSDMGISKVTLTTPGLMLQGGDEATIFAEVSSILATQQDDLTDDAVEIVLVTDGVDASVVHLDVSGASPVAQPLVNLEGVNNLDQLENLIFYFSPTV